MRLGQVPVVGLVAIAALVTAPARTPMARPVAASTGSTIVPLMGDGRLQAGSPDDDGAAAVARASDAPMWTVRGRVGQGRAGSAGGW